MSSRSFHFDSLFGGGLSRQKVAQRLIEAGKLEKAEEILVSLGEWQQAARLASQRRDAPRAAEYQIKAAFGDNSRDFDGVSPREAAELLAGAGHLEEALSLYELVNDYAGAARTAATLGRVEKAARHWERAGEWQQAVECWSALGQDEAQLRALSQQLAALAAQRYQAPSPEVERRARRLDLERAAVLCRLQRPDEARKLLRGWHPESREEVEAWVERLPGRDLVEALLRIEDRQGAAELYRRLELVDAELARRCGLENDRSSAEPPVASSRPVASYPAAPSSTAAARGGSEEEATTHGPSSEERPSGAEGRGPAVTAEAATPSASRQAVELRPGVLLAQRWQILDILGRGSTAQVFKALDRQRGEPVAIKTVLAAEARPGDERRLLHEVQVCRLLDHPNIVKVYDIGRFAGGLFVTMEFIEGLTLDALRTVPQTPARIRNILGQILAGLGEAHLRGIVHRDLKPGNLMISMDTVKIVDFGIARPHGTTESGKVAGSPLYMSPEQFRRHPLDPRSDLYSLGVVAFTLLTGREPFVGRTIQEVGRAHLEQPPPRLDFLRPGLAPGWQELIDRLLAKEPSQRFATTAEVAEALALVD